MDVYIVLKCIFLLNPPWAYFWKPPKSAFIPRITFLHTFISSNISEKGKCRYLRPVKKSVGIKSCKYWGEGKRQDSRGPIQEIDAVGSNSHSEPEVQSVGY